VPGNGGRSQFGFGLRGPGKRHSGERSESQGLQAVGRSPKSGRSRPSDPERLRASSTYFRKILSPGRASSVRVTSRPSRPVLNLATNPWSMLARPAGSLEVPPSTRHAIAPCMPDLGSRRGLYGNRVTICFICDYSTLLGRGDAPFWLGQYGVIAALFIVFPPKMKKPLSRSGLAL